jgi:hypothetical protein
MALALKGLGLSRDEAFVKAEQFWLNRNASI